MSEHDVDWTDYWKTQAHQWELRAWLALSLAVVATVDLMIQVFT